MDKAHPLPAASLAVTLLLLLCVAGASGQYQPNWDSLDARPIPEWYDQSKIGVFIHMGVYSVPGVSEWMWDKWKIKQLPEYVAYMKDNYRPGFSYAEFAPDYRATFFDPKKWVEVVQAAGAKYVVFTCKHHEGFTNWPSDVKWNWNSVDVGPHRDIVGELTAAVRNVSGLRLGLYHSLVEWFHPYMLEDIANGFRTQNFVDSVNIPELKDLVNRYKPDIVWSDGTFHGDDAYWKSEEFIAWLYNESPVKDFVAVNDRWGNNTGCRHGGFYDCEHRFPDAIYREHKFEKTLQIDSKSWGFRKNLTADDIKTPDYIIEHLIKAISCGGNFLINVGPSSDGVIPPIFEERLRQMGAWLQVNGEAIYETKPWTFQNDTISGDVWYTSKKLTNGTAVYANVLVWPRHGQIVLGGAKPTPNTVVTLLGYTGQIPWTKNPSGGMIINVPAIPFDKMPCQWAWSFKLENLM